MSKPPLLSGRQVVAALKRKGYVEISRRGSHIKLKHPVTGTTLIIPDHREVDRWTLKSILRAAEISVDEFARLV